MLPFKDVQYVYTSKCNLAEKTNYCIVPTNTTTKANIEQVKNACDVFKRNNLQVKVLGGNPSDEEDFCQFIYYMNKIGLDYVVTDNAFNIEKLLALNVKGVMFSLDTLGESDIGGCSYVKSMKAKEVITLYHDEFKYLGANVVLNTKNLDEIENIIKFLTEHKAVANICPMITGHNDKFIFRIKEHRSALEHAFPLDIKVAVEKLIEMKRSGYKIGCPEEYLENLPNVINPFRYNWDCSKMTSIPILRVNTDLSLMVCSDLIGSKISEYTIFDIENQFDRINRAWLTDFQRDECCKRNGCYWSNIVIADIYRKQGMGTLEATRRNL